MANYVQRLTKKGKFPSSSQAESNDNEGSSNCNSEVIDLVTSDDDDSSNEEDSNSNHQEAVGAWDHQQWNEFVEEKEQENNQVLPNFETQQKKRKSSANHSSGTRIPGHKIIVSTKTNNRKTTQTRIKKVIQKNSKPKTKTSKSSKMKISYCKFCTMVFPCATDLDNHITDAHGPKAYVCSICRNAYTTEDSLKYHEAQEHRSSNQDAFQSYQMSPVRTPSRNFATTISSPISAISHSSRTTPQSENLQEKLNRLLKGSKKYEYECYHCGEEFDTFNQRSAHTKRCDYHPI